VSRDGLSSDKNLTKSRAGVTVFKFTKTFVASFHCCARELVRNNEYYPQNSTDSARNKKMHA